MTLLALLLAGITAFAWIPVLRRLPEPEGCPDPPGYQRLATPGRALTVGGASALANMVALPRLEPPVAALWAVLGSIGVAAVAIDLETRWMPRRLLHAGWAASLVIGASYAAAGGEAEMLRSLLGAACSAAVLAAFWAWGGGLGFSDVRLALLTGGASGALSGRAALNALLLGSLVGAVWGVVVAARRRRSAPFPFGPSLLLGAYLALLA